MNLCINYRFLYSINVQIAHRMSDNKGWFDSGITARNGQKFHELFGTESLQK